MEELLKRKEEVNKILKDDKFLYLNPSLEKNLRIELEDIEYEISKHNQTGNGQ